LIRRRFALMGLLAVLFALGWWTGHASTHDRYADLDVFMEILKRVEASYVEQVDPSKAIKGAVDGMLHDLDPYSQYLDEQDWKALQDVTRGEFSGIGIVVGVRDGYPVVISPIEGSPAWRAGLRSGDIIVRIDGKPSSGLSIEGAAKLLRGPKGTAVKVAVAREGEDGEHEVEIVRREIETRSVPYSFVFSGDLGYVRLSNFSEKSGEEVRTAVQNLRTRGARRFVLDLRLNPGGLLDQAVDVSEQFLPRGSVVVSTRGRLRAEEQKFKADGPAPDLSSPLVVLVDEGSASASEIVAGALQDLDRALLVGRVTFGKGSVQSVFPLRGNTTALKLTTALYYTPSGRSIHRIRTKPNALAAEDDEEGADGASADSTAARPAFRTAGGRTVFGGGGITPDIDLAADSLPPLSAQIERRTLTFRFANKWMNQHPKATVPGKLPDEVWNEFVDWVRSEKVAGTPAEFAAQRDILERSVRRELARRSVGDAAAARVALEGDPVFLKAAEVLRRAARPSDVFATAVNDRSTDPRR